MKFLKENAFLVGAAVVTLAGTGVLLVMINWAWDYFFYETQVRLITKE